MASRPPPWQGSADTPPSDWTRSAQKTEAAPGLPSPPSSPSSVPEGGFTPGTMLAGRYRVVALLGRGGMGEVYRADDVKLGQPVALKFVRGALSPDAAASGSTPRSRLGRQVSHPSVCRLYDVVEVDGQTFLAMEYVDGEDLASLLARIGRLPADKALDDRARPAAPAWPRCTSKGIVHRDLKPANVMIDGRGRARLTDFGLAVAAGGARAARASRARPAYMAPEQLAGGEVTPRSDLYALGLIALRDGHRPALLRGAHAWTSCVAQHRESKAPQLSSAVARVLDPRVERVIHPVRARRTPTHRPASARARAGRAARDAIRWRRRWPRARRRRRRRWRPRARSATSRPPWPGARWRVVLGRARARRLARRPRPARCAARCCPSRRRCSPSGRATCSRGSATARRADSAYSFEWDQAYIDVRGRAAIRLARALGAAARRAPFPPLHFFYRQSPRRLVAANRDGMVLRDDPPADVSGHGGGRARPARAPDQLPGRAAADGGRRATAWPEPDWSPLFAEAGPRPRRASRRRRRSGRRPWTPTARRPGRARYPGAPRRPRARRGGGLSRPPGVVRGAAAVGRPEPHAGRRARPRRRRSAQVGVLILALAMPLGGVLLARRNLRLGPRRPQGRVPRGALRLPRPTALARLFRADHVASLRRRALDPDQGVRLPVALGRCRSGCSTWPSSPTRAAACRTC